MNMAVIAVVVIVLLVVGIGVANTIQRREVEAAERRNRAAQHRACFRDGQDMLDLGQALPFDASVRDILLDYMHAHLLAIREIDASTPNVNESLNFVNQQRQKPIAADPNLALPSNAEQLTQLRTQIHRVTEFIARLRADPRLNKAKVMQAFQYLARLRLRCDVEGHFKLATMALHNHQVSLAHQYTTYARDRLMQENISDSYVQAQIAELEQMTNAIKLALETAPTTEPVVVVEEEKKGDTDALFAPKKKW